MIPRFAPRPRLATCILGGILLVGGSVAALTVAATIGYFLFKTLGPGGTAVAIVFTGAAWGMWEARQ